MVCGFGCFISFYLVCFKSISSSNFDFVVVFGFVDDEVCCILVSKGIDCLYFWVNFVYVLGGSKVVLWWVFFYCGVDFR